MIQEEKDLLLKDLCARLPYGAKCNISRKNEICIKSRTRDSILDCHWLSECKSDFYEIKPYLFPLSSMTEEQKIKCFEGTDIELDENSEIWSKISSDTYTTITNMNNWLKVINWLLKNHFDIYGIIPKGLAIDCTNLNIY